MVLSLTLAIFKALIEQVKEIRGIILVAFMNKEGLLREVHLLQESYTEKLSPEWLQLLASSFLIYPDLFSLEENASRIPPKEITLFYPQFFVSIIYEEDNSSIIIVGDYQVNLRDLRKIFKELKDALET